MYLTGKLLKWKFTGGGIQLKFQYQTSFCINRYVDKIAQLFLGIEIEIDTVNIETDDHYGSISKY